MKNVLKISIFAMMILYGTMVYSQTNDYANQIMLNINEALSQGDCDHAQKRYNVWKTFADTTDASVESRIAECVKEAKKKQGAGLLMQQINESLSQSDCDDAQLYYNVWKTSSNVSDTAVESRIAECVKANEKSQQNTSSTPNQPSKTSEGKVVTLTFSNYVTKDYIFPIKIYLDNQLIGETIFNKIFQYEDSRLGAFHKLRVVSNIYKWEGKINTYKQTEFIFVLKKKKKGYRYKIELVK